MKDFQKLDLKKVSKNLVKSKLKINIKKNKSIWAVFNEEDEEKLLKIKGNSEEKHIDEQNDLYKKAKSDKIDKPKTLQNNNANLNLPRNNIDINISNTLIFKIKIIIPIIISIIIIIIILIKI